MAKRAGRRLALLLAAPFFGAMAAAAATFEPLPLEEAERLAVAADPAAQRFRDLAAARGEAAVAAGRLPDPVLITEIMDVPADTLRLSDDPMTQLRVGVRQTFPRGATRRLEGERETALAAVEAARAASAERAVVRGVRRAYLELHYQQTALAVLEANRGLFLDLLEITEREFAAGRATQQDVLRAELELERLEDRLQAVETDRAVAESALARWIGPDHARRPLSEEAPPLSTPGAAPLAEHPSMAAEAAARRASRHEVDLARQGYRPQWTVEVTYGRPTTRSDMDEPDRISGMVMLDLPLFTRQRQDRRVAAGMYRQDAAERAWEERLRDLERDLAEAEARRDRFAEREERYRDRLLPRAAANAEAAEQAYRAGTGDFTALMRARVLELEARLDALRVAHGRRLAEADLLYLLGDQPS